MFSTNCLISPCGKKREKYPFLSKNNVVVVDFISTYLLDILKKDIPKFSSMWVYNATGPQFDL